MARSRALLHAYLTCGAPSLRGICKGVIVDVEIKVPHRDCHGNASFCRFLRHPDLRRNKTQTQTQTETQTQIRTQTETQKQTQTDTDTHRHRRYARPASRDAVRVVNLLTSTPKAFRWSLTSPAQLLSLTLPFFFFFDFFSGSAAVGPCATSVGGPTRISLSERAHEFHDRSNTGRHLL